MIPDIDLEEPRDETIQLARHWWPVYVRELHEHGLQIDPENNDEIQEYWDQCWNAAGRHALILIADGDFAGFAITEDGPDSLIDETVPDFEILEFFVLPELRRSGVGRRASRLLFDQHPGAWQIFELAENAPARAFWERAIAEYTNGNYIGTDIDDGEWRGRVQFFDNRQPPPQQAQV